MHNVFINAGCSRCYEILEAKSYEGCAVSHLFSAALFIGFFIVFLLSISDNKKQSFINPKTKVFLRKRCIKRCMYDNPQKQ